MSTKKTYIVFVSCTSSEELETKLIGLGIKWNKIYDNLDDPETPTLAFSGDYTESEVKELESQSFILTTRKEGMVAKC